MATVTSTTCRRAASRALLGDLHSAVGHAIIDSENGTSRMAEGVQGYTLEDSRVEIQRLRKHLASAGKTHDDTTTAASPPVSRGRCEFRGIFGKKADDALERLSCRLESIMVNHVLDGIAEGASLGM